MGLRAREGNWHYRFEIDGHEWSGNTGLAATERNKTAALQAEAKARKLILEGRSQELRIQAIPFNEAASKFLAWGKGHYRKHPNSYKRHVTSFASLSAHFGRTPVSAISDGDVLDFCTWRRNEHKVKEVTIRHDLHSLSKFFRFGLKHQWCRTNPVDPEIIPSDEDSVRINPLSPAQERLYFEFAKRFPSLYDLERLMLLQGPRPEELMKLRVADVDLDRRTMRITAGKSNAAKRTLKLRQESVEILTGRLRNARSEWIFPGKKRGTHLGKVNGTHEKVLRSYTSAVDLETGEVLQVKHWVDCVPYDLRHTFATRAAEAGMSLATLAKILGHSSLRSVMKYVHPSQSELDTAMENLDRRPVTLGQPDGNRTELVNSLKAN